MFWSCGWKKGPLICSMYLPNSWRHVMLKMQLGFFLDISPRADLGQRGWVGKCCIQDSLKYAFQERGKEEIPGRAANSAQRATLSSLLNSAWGFVTVNTVCVQDFGGNVLFYLRVGKKCRHKDQDHKEKHANLIIFSLLHKECFPVVPKLHMQIHWFSVDLHIHLDRKTI